MKKLEFIDYVGKGSGIAYHWTTPAFDFAAWLKPLNSWELWSIKGGKNGKVRMLVGCEDFINVSAYITWRGTGETDTYRFQWTSMSEFEKRQEDFYALSNSITGCKPKEWWKDKKAVSILSVLGDILKGTVFDEAMELGGIETADYWERKIS